MWCSICQADVAAEVSADNSRVRCATCRNDLSTKASSQIEVATKDARDLLERWSNNELLDPFGPPPTLKPQAAAEAPVLDQASPHDSGLPGLRVDRRATAAEPSTSGDAVALDESPQARLAPQFARRDSGHAALPAPHFDLPSMATPNPQRQPNWQSLVGQVFAYFGVLGMFVGTVLVLMGYYGGPEGYAATGWLITTVGQMIMFLGVVTLVSGGMEQTTDEVSRKIESLGNLLIRIEQSSRQRGLDGPHTWPIEMAERPLESPSSETLQTS